MVQKAYVQGTVIVNVDIVVLLKLIEGSEGVVYMWSR